MAVRKRKEKPPFVELLAAALQLRYGQSVKADWDFEAEQLLNVLAIPGLVLAEKNKVSP